jgi:hypothetical protein
MFKQHNCFSYTLWQSNKFEETNDCDRHGVQMRPCLIPSKSNWTYEFQVQDQIGSFFYFLSTNFQRASGGFGPFVINNREVIPIPFAQPDGEIFFMIGDWYIQNHTVSNRGSLIFLL